jgi:predicted phosphoribosyltransferase
MNKTLAAQLHELREKMKQNEAITREDVQLAADVARKLGTPESRVLYANLKRLANQNQ